MDLRDLASTRRRRRKVLKMLSDLLLRLHLTEPLNPPALATKASLAIPLSSNLPNDATVGRAKTSLPASPTPRLICEGPAPYFQTRRCVRPVGESSDIIQDASTSVEQTAASMATVSNAAPALVAQ
ncbi:hypothetical protein DFS33DRAFT_1488913 [Desarmillaria ectypa]|nr:hypothetical protein DFS33DRAFT_1488913 [Desarmillaria ectypa]